MGDRSDDERTRRLGEKDEPGDEIGELFRDDETELDVGERRLMAAVEAKLFAKAPPVEITVDRYVLEGRLGSGGMGVVFKARDPALGRPLAIKFLNADGGASGDRSAGQRRLLREARLIARVSHPNVVSIHDVRPYDELPVEVAHAAGVRGVSMRGVFLVMELVDGESLREWQARPEITREQVLQAYVDAGRGLAAVHDAGLVHRDFKPSNVLVGHDGRVRVLDFGLARSSNVPVPVATPDPNDDAQAEASLGDATVTEAGHVVGTPRYMAPEQFSGEATSPRADVFAFSVSLFEAMTGRFPFVDTNPTVLLAAKRAGKVRELGPDARVAPWLLAILLRGLAPDPTARFAGVGEMVDAIERHRRRKKRWLPTVLVIAGTLVVANVVALMGGEPSTTASPVPPAVPDDTPPRGDPALVAVLPFEIATDDARLGTARDTLPFILAEGMNLHGKLRTVDYFAVRREVEPKGAAPADIAAWREASIRAGAGVLVRGRLEADGADLRLRLELEAADGTQLGAIDRTTTFAALPGTLRTLASEAASRVLGGNVDPPTSRAYAWDYDTLLADGVRYLEHSEFALSITRLDAATAIVPDAPDAWFYLALALSWSEAPDERTSDAIERALATGLDGARREFLLGFRRYIDRDFVGAESVYRAALERWPGDPYLTYGSFEALYHSGHPREAMEVVQGLGGEAPAIHQGLMHVLEYQAAQGNRVDFERALALVETIDLGFAESWHVNASVFAGDYANALEQLGALDPVRHPPGQLVVTRTEVLALTGEVDLALALAEPLARAETANAIPALALQTARGATEERRRYLAIALAEGESSPAELQRVRARSDLVAASLPAADDDELRRLASGAFDPEASLSSQVARALVAGELRERDVLEAATRSSFPEASALAKAAIAEIDGRLDEAATQRREAIASSLDGRFVTVERWLLARVQRERGDLDGAAETCARVIEPPLFHWSWGATVGPCLAWTLEAAEKAGDTSHAAEARELQKRLSGN